MQCPVCHIDLVMSDKHGVEIDYCPKCRGVWLDRGELDEIVRRDAQFCGGGSAPQQSREEHHGDRGYDQKPKKKVSFLGDLFDF